MYPTNSQILTELITRYEGELLAFMRQELPPTYNPEDILQDVWLALSRTLEREELANPRAWLYRTARNRITDIYRQRQRWAGIVAWQPEMEDAWLPADDNEANEDIWEEIMAAIDTLPEAQREVFVRNALEGETLREIAADLGVPLKTVISRKGYARRRLQSLLEETYEEFFAHE
jgi:RNA polymerase sigma factor (sigma-70 family)